MQFSDYQNICVYFAVAALRIQFLSAQNTGSRAGVIKVPSVSLRGNYYIEICKKVSATTSILPNSKSFPRKLEDGARRNTEMNYTCMRGPFPVLEVLSTLCKMQMGLFKKNVLCSSTGTMYCSSISQNDYHLAKVHHENVDSL